MVLTFESSLCGRDVERPNAIYKPMYGAAIRGTVLHLLASHSNTLQSTWYSIF